MYNGLTTAQQAEPRLGIAYNIKQSNTVLRVSYARTLETPFNENLVLSSIGCTNPASGLRSAASRLRSSNSLTPLNPGFRNEFHAGLQQAFGKHVVFDGEYIWKYTHNGYDFSVLGNTPITFPIEWEQLEDPRIHSAHERDESARFHGVCGDVQRGRAFFHAANRRGGRRSRRAPSGRHSASTTTRIQLDGAHCSTSRRCAGRGSASTGATTADWWRALLRATE